MGIQWFGTPGLTVNTRHTISDGRGILPSGGKTEIWCDDSPDLGQLIHQVPTCGALGPHEDSYPGEALDRRHYHT